MISSGTIDSCSRPPQFGEAFPHGRSSAAIGPRHERGGARLGMPQHGQTRVRRTINLSLARGPLALQIKIPVGIHFLGPSGGRKTIALIFFHFGLWGVASLKLLLLTPSLLLLLLLLLRLLLPSFISFRMVQYTGHTKIVPESLETESRASHPNIFLVSQLSMKIV